MNGRAWFLTASSVFACVTAFQLEGCIAMPVDPDGDSFSEAVGDCDNNNPEVYPGARERCNGMDDDCDGVVDEELEGCGAESPTETPGMTETPTPELTPAPTPVATPELTPSPTSTPELTPTAGPTPVPTPELTPTPTSEITPTLTPTPGPVPSTPSPTPQCIGTDADGDGHCVPEDCDDTSMSVHPGALEVCNGRDNDCDGYLPTCWGQAKWGIWSWLMSLFEGE